MGLLHEIQTSLLDETANIGSILLKLRFLADRLGSDVLEDWVRFEAEGYPDKSTTPYYRTADISYKGTFTNGHKTLNNISIPPYLIEKFAGIQWTSYNITDPLSVIETMIVNSDNDNRFGLDVSNLKLLIDGKIYQGYATIELNAHLDIGAFIRITSVVRAKLLDFTLELEKKVPVSTSIVVGGNVVVTSVDTDKVTHITQNTFNAPVHNITTSGMGSPVNVTVLKGDVTSLVNALTSIGLKPEDAKELAEIADSEM